jgi:predicted Zn finger-like uncharacterized protein
MQIPCETCYSKFKLKESHLKPTGSLVRCSKCQKVFTVYPPKDVDPRNSPRVKIKNLIAYSLLNKSGRSISHGLGIALDISEGGILLETPNCIDSASVNLTATDNEKNLIEVKGKIIRTKKASSGMYRHGIKFIGGDERVTKFIATVIKEYNFRGNNLTLKVKQRIKS